MKSNKLSDLKVSQQCIGGGGLGSTVAKMGEKRGKEKEKREKEGKEGERGEEKKEREKGERRKEREGKIKSKRKKLLIIGSGGQKQNT